MSTLAKQLAEKAREKGAIADKNQFFSVTDKKKVDGRINSNWRSMTRGNAC
jgi:hypothetical protein